MKRQIYLSMKSLEEARELFLSSVGRNQRSGVEEINVKETLGRITAKPVFAKRSSPSFHSAAMDGIAVKADQTYGTTERRPKALTVGKDAVWINTGQPLPGSFDSVIMVEKLHQLDETHLEIRSASFPWQNVRKVGEDIVATELLLPQNHKICPYDMGALISAGVFSIAVWKRPKVVIIPTGSELVHYTDLKNNEPLEGARIIEYNSIILAGMVSEAGGESIIYDIIPDEPEKLLEALKSALNSDAHIIVINAGSSAGSKDYTAHMIKEMGEVLVHGVAMMPGKPTILGKIDARPVVGNPGYAVSAALSFEQFVKPLLYSLQGQKPPAKKTIKVKPTRDIPSRLGTDEFLRVNIGKVGTEYVATPLPRAAGSITTLTRAEGIIRIPALSEGITQNEEIEAELLVDEEDLLNTVVIIGSHDMTIDILADEVRRKGPGVRIASSNVGSLGGLLALKKGICHISGSHLLDTETGDYNISYINRYLKGVRVTIFHLVLREQGLIVARGNPKNIMGLEDLTRKDITFVNRQAGSGTRVLLDYKLSQQGIETESIRGYDRDEFTHMAVAVDVLSGAADCGMGIFAAAKALDLHFIPLEKEQYDLIVPSDLLDVPSINTLLETVQTEHFRNRVISLGGYDPSKSGQFWIELEGG